MDTLQNYLYIVPAALIAITLHEYAHGYVSYKLGDPTPAQTGRLSLNPMAHLDLVGTLCLILFKFGWAKPVQVNPYYYKNKKSGMVLVGIAGPAMNFLIALICAIVMSIIIKVTRGNTVSASVYALFKFINISYILNIGLGVFNLIPFPPLDGAKIVGGLLPENLYFKWMKYEKYGQLVVFGLLALGFLDMPLGVMRGFVEKVLWTITKLIIK